MNYSLTSITAITKGALHGKKTGSISEIVTDSRSSFVASNALFVALAGAHNDGHRYLQEMYDKGVRAFVVSQKVTTKNFPQASFLQVENTLEALQKLAAHHREQFLYPVLGITGSNGKTIVKEWITQLLLLQIHLLRSPKSYNSQLGVPLSVWKMDESFDLAIFEAGISLPNEMEQLEKVIRPNLVVLTNIGEAHQEGFATRDQKLREKLKLCASADAIIFCADQYEIYAEITNTSAFRAKQKFTWGVHPQADLRILQNKSNKFNTHIVLQDAASDTYKLTIPFTDKASVENALHSFAACYCLARQYPQLKIDITKIVQGIEQLVPVVMRLDLREGINGCTIINDAYSADVPSLRIALDFLTSFTQHTRHTVILSDIEQSGKESWRLYREVADLLNTKKVSRLIGIGTKIAEYESEFHCPAQFFANTEQFLRQFDATSLHNEAVLVKGSRSFGLEKISQQLEQRTHLTTLEVNLTALADNLNTVRSELKEGVKTLVLVKAFAYGAGICEVARLLQHRQVDYLGVAVADEGVALRQAGITLPVLVLNPEPGAFDQIVAHRLEPEIYSLNILKKFNEAVIRAGETNYPVHIKLDTGMHRLGFLENETPELLQGLQQFSHNLHVAGIFSHFAAADEEQHDDFTRSQIQLFDIWSKTIEKSLGYKVIRHIANSAGTVRFPEAQMDMIRLGISFYGVNAYTGKHFRTVSTLKTTIVQIKTVPAGDTIGYGRKGKAVKDTRIGLIPIGYADGLNRLLSNGKGKMLVNGKYAPIIGNICMDMSMIDLSGIAVDEGDEVIIFGENPSVESLAEQLNTIPYEILTRISSRVKRVYFSE